MELSTASILLTGGTGSFGSAFVHRAAHRWPDCTLRVFSRDELKQSELQARYPGAGHLRFFLGDVRDRERLRRAMQGVDVVVHAAAMKQVPACEYNPSEAIQTNVAGSQNVVDAAIDAGVARVVFISTDKAVNPVNLYGGTKLCAEKLVVQGNSYVGRGPTRLCCVRYGNVVGSRGSVIPLFLRQRESGTLTLTDERMTRFWITMDQALDLVEYAVARTHGGEVFIPRIPSIRVTELAAALAPGVPTTVIGIRPGEKLHEILLTAEESRHTVVADDYYVVLPEHHWWQMADAWAAAPPVPEAFTFSSDTNDRWLTGSDVTAFLDAAGYR